MALKFENFSNPSIIISLLLCMSSSISGFKRDILYFLKTDDSFKNDSVESKNNVCGKFEYTSAAKKINISDLSAALINKLKRKNMQQVKTKIKDNSFVIFIELKKKWLKVLLVVFLHRLNEARDSNRHRVVKAIDNNEKFKYSKLVVLKKAKIKMPVQI